MTDPPFVRPGTDDAFIWGEVYSRREHPLPSGFDPRDVVLDVGVHIGSFSRAALDRGAGHVFGFEADSSNLSVAAINLRKYADRITLHHLAVWRSDRHPQNVLLRSTKLRNSDRCSTANGEVMSATDGTPVPTIAFDELVRRVSQDGELRIRLVKIDCEGSEFPILLTSSNFGPIDEIVGEYHTVDEKGWSTLNPDAQVDGFRCYSPEDLCYHLAQHGFSTRLGPCRPGTRRFPEVGMFIAWRTVPCSAAHNGQ